MSSVALSSGLDRVRDDTAAVARSWAVPVAIVVGLAFYLTDHHFYTSRSEAFAGTAESYEAAAGGGNLIRRIAFLSLALLGLAGLLVAAPARKAKACGFGGLLLATYVGWCVLSIVWSDDSSVTIRRVFVLLCFAFGALGLARRLTGRQLLQVALGLTTAYLAIGFVAELVLGTFRPWSSEHRFSGTLHPNTQGLNLTVLCLCSALLGRESNHRGRYWALFTIGFLFLVLTKSRTSTAGLLLALATIWTLSTDPRVKAFAGLAGIWLVSAVLLIVSFLGIDLVERFAGVALMGRGEQSESLTGRLPLWTQLSDFVSARPLAGYGHDSFWTTAHIETVSEEQGWGIREAHNSYLDTTLSTGLIGLALLVTAVVLGLFRAAATYTRSGQPLPGFVFGMTVFSLVNACTESGMVMPTFVPFLLTIGLLQIAFFPDGEMLVARAAGWRTA